MAASPRFKVYDAAGTYQAACKEAEIAAACVSCYGDGATIRWDHRRVLWTEGPTGDGYAGESYDHVAQTVHERLDASRPN